MLSRMAVLGSLHLTPAAILDGFSDCIPARRSVRVSLFAVLDADVLACHPSSRLAHASPFYISHKRRGREPRSGVA